MIVMSNDAQKISGDICSVLESNLSPFTDCYFLEFPVEEAVRHCLSDAPHGGACNVEPDVAMAETICLAVQSVLASYRLSPDWVARMRPVIEHAVLQNLRRMEPDVSAEKNPGRKEAGHEKNRTRSHCA